MGIRTVFTDHSLFGFEDAASILTNKLLAGTLRNVDAVICVSHTGRENTVLRGQLYEHDDQAHPRRMIVNRNVYVIPNALVGERFKPFDIQRSPDEVVIVVVARLAYRKGIDLLVAAAPRICSAFPQVKFIIGGDGPKLIDILQMRERHRLQDRIELLGPVRPNDVCEVLNRGTIFLSTSLTESFGIAIVEAACAGLYVVATRVGGVSEVLPEDMISFANPDADDLFRAVSEAITIVSQGKHDPFSAHERVKMFYNWDDVTERTELVYEAAINAPQIDLLQRIHRTMQLGPFAGPIYTIILIVDCLFFLFLEWWMPREDLDFVTESWDGKVFVAMTPMSLVSNPVPVIFLAPLAAVAAWTFLHRRARSKLPLPPGPKKYPIIGNLLDLPSEFEWFKYLEWSKEYGSDVIHLDAAGVSVIVLNTLEATNDLFEKRSSIYSSRPHFPMINELMGWAWAFAFMPYGDAWRLRRRMFQQEFHPSATTMYRPQEVKYVRRLLHRLLVTPEEFMSLTRHATNAVIMDISYAYDVLPKDDPYVDMAGKALHGLTTAAVPGAFLVDSFPILKYVPSWMPGAGFKRRAREWRICVDRMIKEPFETVKINLAKGTAKPSVATQCLDNVDPTKDIEYQEQIIRETIANFYAAGSDTTVSALNTFFLAMLRHPEVQINAQKELDEVLGGRLPEFDDEASLPYISAIVKEVLRWEPVTPIAIPHLVTEDDVYRGYRIPANSMVVGNAWAILHDETMYPEPFSFKPDRWLTPEGQLNPDIRDPTVIFGFGRRICPGRHIATSTLWIAAASILTTFNITKAKDPAGNIIEPDGKYHSAMICHALPFKCTIKPRSKSAEQLILSIPLQ
ncbi:hypothetical protein ONZ45_g12030 [Pleurotus djamor]|nr:hypothetical protein ONZ45_g12030 [Pleurotus djamor]